MKNMIKPRDLYILFVLILALASASCSSSHSNDVETADLIILNAYVFTSNVNQPQAEALAVKGERILSVGSKEEVLKHRGSKTRVLDAEGKMLVPGFIDNHVHSFWLGALTAIEAQLFDARSFEEMRQIVVDFAAQNPDNPFVMALGWRYALVPGGKPTTAIADTILRDRPLILWSEDGHSGWVNTLALQILSTRNPAAFQWLTPQIDPSTQKPTGMLLHFFEFNPFDFFPFSELGANVKQRMFDRVIELIAEGVSYGITAAHDVQLYKSFLPWVEEFKTYSNYRNMRIRGAYYIAPHHLEDENALRSDLMAWRELGERLNDEYLILGDSVKLYMDGVSQNHTAFHSQPYADADGTFPPNGFPIWTQGAFNRVMEIVDGMKIQAATHGCGNEAIRMIIDGYEHALQANGVWDARHRIEHNETPSATDRRRMARLGVFAANQPVHFVGSITLDTSLGAARMPTYMPWKDLEDAGVEMSFGSDGLPEPPPFNPLFGLLIATTRYDYTGTIRYPGQAVSIENAIRHYTIGSARALKIDRDAGSLEKGKYADFALFSIDLRDIPKPEFLALHPLDGADWNKFVILTAVGGKIVYQNPEYNIAFQ
jgi:predicted amidohydrolase YtcJ